MKNHLMFMLSLLFFMMLVTSLAKADELAPTEISGAETIDTDRAGALLDEAVPFIDVRSMKDFEAGHIPGAYHLAVHSEDFTPENLKAIVNKDQAVVFYCNGITCMGSSAASQKAVEWGWTHVIYYREGFRHWQAEGRPIE